MNTIRIVTKATIDDIVRGGAGGVSREYIVNPLGTSRLDRLVRYSNYLADTGNTPYMEVKFRSKYSSREKRLEIVAHKDGTFTIFKFSSQEKYDKDAIELSRIISEIMSLHNLSATKLVGCLLIPQGNDIQFIQQYLFKSNINILVKNY